MNPHTDKQETTEEAYQRWVNSRGIDFSCHNVSAYDAWCAGTERAEKRIKELEDTIGFYVQKSHKEQAELNQRDAEILELRQELKDTEEKLSWYVLNSNVQIDE